MQIKAWIQPISCYVRVGCAKGVGDGVETIRDILQVLHINADIPKPHDDWSVVKLYLVYLMMVSMGQVVWKDRTISK
jgi:hypothetical protein